VIKGRQPPPSPWRRLARSAQDENAVAEKDSARCVADPGMNQAILLLFKNSKKEFQMNHYSTIILEIDGSRKRKQKQRGDLEKP
jgi:hypothetical protein